MRGGDSAENDRTVVRLSPTGCVHKTTEADSSENDGVHAEPNKLQGHERCRLT